LQCPNCSENNIQFGEVDFRFGDPETDKVIYPLSVTYKAPSKIDLQFRAAIEIAHTNPSAAVGQFRVILEMIWADKIPKGTPKPHLRGEKGIICQLVDAQILAGDYAEMADVLAS